VIDHAAGGDAACRSPHLTVAALKRRAFVRTLVLLATPSLLVAGLVSPIAGMTDPVVVAAGDIADCHADGGARTAQLLDTIAGTVITTGDNAYPEGTVADYRDCYDLTWGRHKARTRPAPGNHDYLASHGRGAAYHAYFGASAGPAGRGYYSFDLGAWHLVSLNSTIAADTASAQAQWLRADLVAHPAACTLAYWHHSVRSSGSHHGSNAHMAPIWDILAAAGADVILSSHEHNYERFDPQTSSGQADPEGPREFVIGTGGASHYAFGPPQPNSAERNADTFGVLKLTLHPTSYDWEFVPVAGGAFHDAGSASCHGGSARDGRPR
jgi:hypothetical protein